MRYSNIIIRQKFPPKTFKCLWDDGTSLNIYRDGKWYPVVKTMSDETTTRLIETLVVLDVCTSGSVEAEKNLEKLTQAYLQLGDHFTVNIDAGIGVGKFIPNRGGEGYITTTKGVNAYYRFGSDGSVVKEKEVDLNAILADLDDRIAALETA